MTTLLEKVLVHYKCDETIDGATLEDAHILGIDLPETNDGANSFDVDGKFGTRARRVTRAVGNNQRFVRADTGVSDEFRLSNYTNGFFINAWVNQKTNIASTKKTIVAKQTTGLNEFFHRIDTATGTFEAGVVNTDPTAFVAQSTSTLATGSPALSMCTLVYRATTQTVEAWFDGVLEATAVLTGTPGVGAAPFTICGESGIGLYHDGDVEEITIGKEPATSSDIEFMFNGGAGRPFSQFAFPQGGFAVKGAPQTASGQQTTGGLFVLVPAPSVAHGQGNLRILVKRIHISISNTSGSARSVNLQFDDIFGVDGVHYVRSVPASGGVERIEIDTEIPVAPASALSMGVEAGFTGAVDWTVTYQITD